MHRILLFALLLLMSHQLIAQDLMSSNLPIVKITTSSEIVDEPKVDGTMTILYNGPDQRNNFDGDTPHISQKIGIEIRGQSSQWFDKKGYGFEWRDDAGDDLDTAFLSFPAESDFVLHGPYSDKSLLRNAMAYIIGGSIMNYAPRVEMVEVMINDDYKGVYLLTEKIKRDGDRVDVNKLKSDEIEGDDLTGGYIFKTDKIDDGDVFWSSGYDPFPGAGGRPNYVMSYPKSSDIVPQQRSYIQGVVANFENVMNSSSYQDPSTGYPNIIDIQTFVDFFFINEISRNVDGYRISTFFHKDKDSNGGKIKAGPVWDFNLGFGNADYCDGWATTGWAYNFNDVCPGDGFSIPFWWVKLIESQTFAERTGDRWDALRTGPLSTDRILQVYDSLGTLLSEAAARNFERFDILGTYVWPNSQVSATYLQELQWTRNWIISRLDWMDAQINSFPSGITNEDYVTDFQIYPTPFDEQLYIDFISLRSGSARMEIVSSIGQTIWEQNLQLQAGQHTRESYNLLIPSGYYIYQIVQNNTIVKSGKLIRK